MSGTADIPPRKTEIETGERGTGTGSGRGTVNAGPEIQEKVGKATDRRGSGREGRCEAIEMNHKGQPGRRR